MCLFFFFNDTATTEIYTLSLHDALLISGDVSAARPDRWAPPAARALDGGLSVTETLKRTVVSLSWSVLAADRKSTRLNSSHANISYAVFCLKKKKKT